MRLMRLLAACALVLAVGLIASGPATAQEDVMQLEAPAFTTHQRPSVTFDHATHSEDGDCKKCHHYYENGKLDPDNDSAGTPCSECHAVNAASGTPLMLAYHTQCIGCHKKTLKEDKNVGGLMCGQCHVRK